MVFLYTGLASPANHPKASEDVAPGNDIVVNTPIKCHGGSDHLAYVGGRYFSFVGLIARPSETGRNTFAFLLS